MYLIWDIILLRSEYQFLTLSALSELFIFPQQGNSATTYTSIESIVFLRSGYQILTLQFLTRVHFSSVGELLLDNVSFCKLHVPQFMGTLVLLLGSGYQIWTLLLSSKFIYSIGELLLNITSFNNSMYLNWGLVLPRSESLLSFVSCPHRPVSGKPLLISTPFTALWLAANIDFKNVTWLFKLSNGNAEKKRKRKKEIRMIYQRRTHKNHYNWFMQTHLLTFDTIEQWVV